MGLVAKLIEQLALFSVKFLLGLLLDLVGPGRPPGHKPSVTPLDPMKTITRCEIETKSRLAGEFVKAFLMGGPTRLLADLDSRLSFRVPNKDSNKSRWPRQDWWERFLNLMDEKPVKILRPVIERDLHEKKRWFEKYWGPTLRLLHEEFGDGWVDQILVRTRTD